MRPGAVFTLCFLLLAHRALVSQAIPRGSPEGPTGLAELAGPAGRDAAEKSQVLARIDSLRVHFQALAALDAIEAELPAARGGTDRHFLLELLIRQGMVNASFGRARAGEPVLREAVSLAEALGDSLLLCEGLRWLALSLTELGRTDESDRLQERLLAVAQACRSPRYEGWAQVGMAWRDYVEGRSAESAGRYREALALFEAGADTRGVPWAWNGLGTALSRLGRYDEALACHKRAVSLARVCGDDHIESLALNNLGTLAFSLGDPGAALDHFARSEALHRRMGYTRGAFTPALNVAYCRILLGRFDDAEAALESLLEDCRREGNHDHEGMALNLQADLETRRGRLHRAASLYRRSLDLGPHLPLKNRVEAWVGLAGVQRRLGEPRQALRSLQAGRREIADRDLFLQSLALADESGLCLQLIGRHHAAIDRWRFVTEEADREGLSGFRVSGLARAAASCRALGLADSSLALLREAAAAWEAERELPLDPEWREQRGEAGSLLYTDLAAQLLAPMTAVPDPVRFQQAFDQMQAFKARTLLERMLGPGREAADLSREQPPVHLRRLQDQVLREGELLLDYYLGPNVSFLFAVTRDRTRAVTLPDRDTLGRKLEYYYRFLSRPPGSPASTEDGQIIRQSGRHLRELLLGPVEDLLQASTLVFFCPDDRLNLLAPATLWTTARDSAGPDVQASPARAGIAWSRIPSATVLAHLRQGEPATAEYAGAASPRPDHAGAAPSGADHAGAADRILAVAGLHGPGGEPLPGAREEVDLLVDRFRRVDLHLGGEADSGDGLTTADLAPYALLHLAAHASIDDQYPWRSAVHCAGAEQQGRLLAADIAGCRLGARLAVLAACESAGGRVLSGEGVLGLASAFLGAGVPAVVATLWPVDDARTARLMGSFYSHLERGQTAALALQEARRAMQSDPACRDPFFWAGFVLVGDGGIDVKLERRRPPIAVVPILLAGGAILMLALSFRRRSVDVPPGSRSRT
jgi:tetratricopeptide (TPR) repeat protein